MGHLERPVCGLLHGHGQMQLGMDRMNFALSLVGLFLRIYFPSLGFTGGFQLIFWQIPRQNRSCLW